MSVYGYCRVSTDRQANEGESLGVQERQLQGYVHMQGMKLDRVFVERGVSGSIPLADRPEGAAMLACLDSLAAVAASSCACFNGRVTELRCRAAARCGSRQDACRSTDNER